MAPFAHAPVTPPKRGLLWNEPQATFFNRPRRIGRKMSLVSATPATVFFLPRPKREQPLLAVRRGAKSNNLGAVVRIVCIDRACRTTVPANVICTAKLADAARIRAHARREVRTAHHAGCRGTLHRYDDDAGQHDGRCVLPQRRISSERILIGLFATSDGEAEQLVPVLWSFLHPPKHPFHRRVERPP